MTLPDPIFQPLAGIFEPSAIQQLPDGRFLVVEDEKSHPFCLLTLYPDGSVGSTPLIAEVTEAEGNFRKLDDLEGLALDPSGALYAINRATHKSALTRESRGRSFADNPQLLAIMGFAPGS